MLFSASGWAVDTVSASIQKKGIIDKGFLVGPVCPMYGFLFSGAYLLDIFVCKGIFFVQLGIFSFFAAFSFFAVNIFFRRYFNILFWDFSGTGIGYKSYMSLSTSVLWGLVLTVITRTADGFITKLIVNELPDGINLIVCVLFFSLLLCDTVFSFLLVMGMRHKAESFKDIIDRIKRIENKAEKAILDTTQRSELSLRVLRLEIILRNLPVRLKKMYSELKLKVLSCVSRDTVFTRRIKKSYDSFINSENAERLQQNIEEHRKINMKQYEHIYSKKEARKKSFAYGLNYCKLFLLFFIGSIMGCIMETCFAIIYEGHFEMRVGLVYGPFIPVYGFGAVLLTLALSHFYKSSFIGLFAVSSAVGAAFEYFCSWLQETIFGTISWDYSDMPFNIDGRTSLAYACIWGILGVVWVREMYPVLSRGIEKIPPKIGYIITIVLTVFMVFNAFVSASASIRANERSENIEAQNAFAVYLDNNFSDEYLEYIYPHAQKVEKK